MNIFLVHGSFGKPFENWFPWLEEELSFLYLFLSYLSIKTNELLLRIRNS